jgi:hypothetical protein
MLLSTLPSSLSHPTLVYFWSGKTIILKDSHRPIKKQLITCFK